MAKSFQILRDKMSPERQLEAKRRTNEMLAELALQELRQSLNLTQRQVAEIMQLHQAGVSKIEHQSDIYVSTLQKFVWALGGHLKLVASFPDREVAINQFEFAGEHLAYSINDSTRTIFNQRAPQTINPAQQIEERKLRGKFELKSAKGGKFVFNLKASNGHIILSSETYDTKKAAEKGIASVRKNAASNKRFETLQARDGSYYFILTATNGEIIGKSEMYKTARSAAQGIDAVQKSALEAFIPNLEEEEDSSKRKRSQRLAS
jgi:uncharacterized protein